MKKIMFNDEYGLTKAVLEGRKTMMRRMAYNGDTKNPCIEWRRLTPHQRRQSQSKDIRIAVISTYALGEDLAVSQSYKDAGVEFIELYDRVLHDIRPPKGKEKWGYTKRMAGYTNKMFVRADLMPHRIRITDIKVERLQDISDEDCMKEGVGQEYNVPKMEGTRLHDMYTFPCANGSVDVFETPREAFAALIDRVSGRGTWDSNPYVFVYSFELIK